MLPATIATFLRSQPHEPTSTIADRWHQATNDLKSTPNLIASSFYFWCYNHIHVEVRGDLYQLCPNGFTGRIHYAPINYNCRNGTGYWLSAQFEDAIVIIPNPTEILARLDRYDTPAFSLR